MVEVKNHECQYQNHEWRRIEEVKKNILMRFYSKDDNGNGNFFCYFLVSIGV
jgi:hypothetical protein